MKTRITELFGIKHPIIQGAMSWVAFPRLVAAVSNAGGLGILGAAFMSPDELHRDTRGRRQSTDADGGEEKLPFQVEVDVFALIDCGHRNARAEDHYDSEPEEGDGGEEQPQVDTTGLGWVKPWLRQADGV